jgi:hypothetical protein
LRNSDKPLAKENAINYNKINQRIVTVWQAKPELIKYIEGLLSIFLIDSGFYF